MGCGCAKKFTSGNRATTTANARTVSGPPVNQQVIRSSPAPTMRLPRLLKRGKV